MSYLLVAVAVALGLLVAVVGPLVLGRWLSDRERAIQAAEVAALEAQALRLMAGRLD